VRAGAGAVCAGERLAKGPGAAPSPAAQTHGPAAVLLQHPTVLFSRPASVSRRGKRKGFSAWAKRPVKQAGMCLFNNTAWQSIPLLFFFNFSS